MNLLSIVYVLSPYITHAVLYASLHAISTMLSLSIADEDFEPISARLLNFDSNVTTQCVDIVILFDTDQTEGTEVFSMEIPFIDVLGEQESDELVPPVNVSILDLGI